MFIPRDDVASVIATVADRWGGGRCGVLDVCEVRTLHDDVAALVVVDGTAAALVALDRSRLEARLVQVLGARSVRITMRHVANAAA